MKNLREKELRKIANEIVPEDKKDLFVKFFQIRFLEEHEEQSMYTDEYATIWAKRFNSRFLLNVCDSLSFDILIKLGYPCIWTYLIESEDRLKEFEYSIRWEEDVIYFNVRGNLYMTNCKNYQTFKTFCGIPATDKEKIKYEHMKKINRF